MILHKTEKISVTLLSLVLKGIDLLRWCKFVNCKYYYHGLLNFTSKTGCVSFSIFRTYDIDDIFLKVLSIHRIYINRPLRLQHGFYIGKYLERYLFYFVLIGYDHISKNLCKYVNINK